MVRKTPSRKLPGLTVKRSSPGAGFGLYTELPIKKGTTVIEYIGKRVRTTDPVDNRYIFNVNTRWDIDGSPRWNIARYVNHSCRPNCEAVDRKGEIFIVARRSIKAGEELSYDYGKEYFDEYIKPQGCRCPKCSAKAGTKRV